MYRRLELERKFDREGEEFLDCLLEARVLVAVVNGADKTVESAFQQLVVEQVVLCLPRLDTESVLVASAVYQH